MWCNYYNSETVGEQPIRVYRKDTFTEFERIKNSLHSWFPNKNLDKIVLNYKTGEQNIKGPCASNDSISLDETFLSAYWNYCFGLTLSTPLPWKIYDLKDCNPYDSLTYCRNLLNGYCPWDTEKLPNPELRKRELADVIKFIGHIYSTGLYFMIIHEFAHIIRGDIYQGSVSQSNYHQLEFACDNYAFEVFASSTELNDPKVILGLLSAVGLLTFASSFKEQFTRKHPFPDERLINIVNAFESYSSIGSNHHAWIISTWILVTWDFIRNKVFPGTDTSVLNNLEIRILEVRNSDYKQVFGQTLKNLQEKKIWLDS